MVTASILTGATYTWSDYLVPLGTIALALFLAYLVNKGREPYASSPVDPVDRVSLSLGYVGIIVAFCIYARFL